MDQSTPQQPSRKKTILSLTVLVVLTGIVFWIFQRHWAEISAALAQLRFWQVLLVLAVGLTYPVLEGLVSWVIIRSRMPGFTVRQALESSFMGTFGNVICLGAGAMPMQSYYLYRSGLPLGPGVGLMTLQYVFHKTTVLLYATGKNGWSSWTPSAPRAATSSPTRAAASRSSRCTPSSSF
mgnify:CR=1 FL=1